MHRTDPASRRRFRKIIQHTFVVLWMLHAVLANQYAGRCHEACVCLPYYHPMYGYSVRVHCKMGGMTTMPVEALETNISQLIITPQANNPNHFTLGPFLSRSSPLTGLRDLTIMNSNVPYLGERTFWGLSNLRMLNLTGNNLTIIHMENFRGLANLINLSLDYNHIKHMSSEAFKHLGTLNRLSLAHNEISTLVPRMFRMLGRLQYLDLSFNPLHELVPDVFKDIQNLMIFKCRRCYLKHINVQIYHIAPLIEELDLGQNLFDFITDDDFYNLKKLRKLEFDRNQVAVVVDNSFKGNKKLEFLSLSRNRIALLAPSSLNNLTSLAELDISYNKLNKFNLQAFSPVVKSIRSINFGGNNLPLNEISILLQILPGLNRVGLADLALKYIPENFFMYNKHITDLDLSRNLLDKFPYKLLLKTRYLQTLDISNNKLTELNADHLRRLEAIPWINLSPNTWQCDHCTVEPIRLYMNTTVLNETLRTLRCHTPSRLRGVYISDLTPDQIETCFASSDSQMSIFTGLSLVTFSVLLTGLIAFYCTRRRGSQYSTDEEKRRRQELERQEELLASINSGSVSTIQSPSRQMENSS